MNKKIIWTLALLLTLSSLGVMAAGVDKLPPLNGPQSPYASNDKSSNSSASKLDINSKYVYYPNATIKSVAAKYKYGNYSGCLQEIYSILKKQPSNATAYYYLALVYTHLDKKEEAVAAYEKVIELKPSDYLVQFATKGKDCLTGGPACHPQETVQKQEEQLDDLDKFIRAPYGNGLSPELNNEIRQKELTNIKETINQKENLENKDIQKIKQFDNSKSEAEETIKIAQVSDEDVLNAINTLKEAGVNVSVQSENSNPYAAAQYQDPRMSEMSMLLGNGNNNNNSMMNNMLPMLMMSQQKGENVDPRLMQAVMMNSMMSDFNYMNNNNNNNNY